MFLGLDLGTSGLKALLADENGAVASATAHYDVQAPHTGWSEQEPARWIDAAKTVFSELREVAPEAFGKVQAIGFSGHMHGAVCVDASGEPIRPCILWNDMRSEKQAARLDANPIFHDMSGNIVFPGFTAPKLCWMAEHEPENFANVHKVLLPKDYLVYWLTGRFVTDRSDGAGTAWLDVGARKWSGELLAASGMRTDQMPDLVEGCEVVGEIVASLASEFGLPKNVRIVAGGADNAVAAIGAGAVEPTQGFVSLGTSGVVVIASDKYSPDAANAVHTFCHSVPDRWYQMGVMLSATNSLNWLARQMGQAPAEMGVAADTPLERPSDITFLPYMTGERTPHNNAHARGAFFGLSLYHSTVDMTHAVMEGVSFGLRDCLDALEKTGNGSDELLALGGGTKSARWLETLATVLDTPLLLPEKGNYGAALGAARLAMIGDGANIGDVVTMPPIERVVRPRTDLTDAFSQKHDTFKNLYKNTKDLL